jgi:uncharacterized delta-60 repeat protein
VSDELSALTPFFMATQQQCFSPGSHRRRRVRQLCATVILAVVATAVVAGQSARDATPLTTQPKSSGLLVQGRDGTLLVGSGARIPQQAGLIDKVGSFFLGLGSGAPDFDSAALSLMRFTAQGVLDPRFGKGGLTTTPLLPLRNRNRATVTALLQDTTGRPIVVGWRDQWTALDANILVVVAARYTASGALDPSFGEQGVVTTRVDQTFATQAFAAALDADGRLLVAGYSGGRKTRDSRGSYDDWSVRIILLRYTSAGVLDTSFGERGVASQPVDPSGRDTRNGRDFLVYDYKHAKTAALAIDRLGRAVVAASTGEAAALLMRFTPDGKLDPTFGTTGMVQTTAGAGFNISTLLRDSDGRWVAAGTMRERMVVVRYSADGVPDPTFGTGAVSSTPMSTGMRVSAALQQEDGHLLVAASGENGVHLARFDRDGMPDRSFGSAGVILSAPGRRIATPAGLAIDASGIPIVAGASGDWMFLMRYPPEGPVDSSFKSPTTARP